MASLLRISDAASLGLHAMVLLADRTDGPVTVHDAATVFDVSEAHLSKVMQRLVRAGLVRSIRGPKGGFLLARPPGTITLLDVYEAIEGPLPEQDCLLATAVCGGAKCILGDLLKRVHTEIGDYLASKTLSDVTPAYECLHSGKATKP